MSARLKRYTLRTVIGLLALLVAAIAVAITWRLIVQASVRNSRPVIGEQGVDELFETRIGGIDQWLHVRGMDERNPLLLYLHGGPGTPMMPFSPMFQNEIEKDFIVVQWDQRGAGKTYFETPAGELQSMDYERMVADAVEVTQFVRQRYHKQKIVVLGHSWGSMLGVGLVQQHPELFYAYVGTGQVVNVARNEQVGYEATLAEARRRNDPIALQALNSLAPYPDADGAAPPEKMDTLREWQQAFGFAVSRRYKGEIEQIMVANALRSPEYGWRDVSYFLEVDTNRLWPKLRRDVNRFNVAQWGNTFRVPVVFLLGRHDWQTPSTLAAEWLETIAAPSKRVVWLEDSAHSPMIDEPEKFAAALREVVKPLATGEHDGSAQ
jgi:proline iminopeptidase